MQKELGRKSWGKSWRQIFKGVSPKWHGPFQARFTPSVIPSEVEESLILTIPSSKRCLDCARHDKKPILGNTPLTFRFIHSLGKQVSAPQRNLCRVTADRSFYA